MPVLPDADDIKLAFDQLVHSDSLLVFQYIYWGGFTEYNRVFSPEIARGSS